MTEQQPAPTAAVRPVLWPTRAGRIVDTADTSLADAGSEELRSFAEHYADVPLLELMRRLRLAEWNAAHYRGEAEAAAETTRRMPSPSAIREMDARHTRIRGLLDAPGRISRAGLEAALREPTATP
ncbi:hypothetical protein AB0M68_03800 [Streptomyces sp. NPDC051453]|uniref:hypothetical protein n=1 Tax=Streptomyces sp. NPDC051453 TaxID=3154941 RepID=UPI003411FBD1